MGRRELFAAILIGLACSGAAGAHGSDGDAVSAAAGSGPHDGESWFSAPKDNETENDVRDLQEQLAIQRTGATMSCAEPRELAALDHRGEALDIRLEIAIARQDRARARKSGDTKLAAKLERRVHRAKLKLLQIVERAPDRSSRPE